MIDVTDVPLYLFLLYIVFSSLWSPGYSISIIKVVLCALFMFIVILEESNKQKLQAIYYIVLVLLLLALFFFGEFYYGGNRFSIVYDGLSYEFGIFFGYAILGVAIISQYFLGNENKKMPVTIFYILISIISLYYLLLSGTRGILLGIFAAIMISFGFNKKSIKGLLLILAMMLAFYVIYNMFLSDYLRERFTLVNVISSRASSRFDIWERVLDYSDGRGFFRNLFGDGVYSTKAIFGATSDNTYIDMLFEYGYIGIVLFLSYNFRLLFLEIRYNCIIALSTHVGILIWMFSVPLTYELVFWALLYIIRNMVRWNIKNVSSFSEN